MFQFIFLGLAIMPEFAQALTHDEYLEQLAIADQHVAKRKERAASHALSAESLGELTELRGGIYKVGDWWEVAATHLIPLGIRKSEVTGGKSVRVGKVGIFRY